MRNLLCILAVGLVLLVPACGLDVELQMGTVAWRSKVSVDEWAQANVLKALDKLIEGEAKDGEPAPGPKEEVTPVLE